VICNSKKRLLALAFALAATAALVATTAIATPSEIRDKKAEAEAVLAQIQEIDAQLGLAIEAYNGATVRLGEIEEDIQVNTRHLEIARKAYREAQANLAERLVGLYTSNEQDVIEVMLGSANLDDLLDRLDSVRRISAQDLAIIEDVREAKGEMKRRSQKLAKARGEQRTVVNERAARKEAVEAKLAERQQLLGTIEDEIVQLEAEERERQRRLREEAEQRLEAERAAQAAAEAASSSGGSGTSAPPPEIVYADVPPSRYGSAAVDIAMQYLGVPYVWGGASPSGFDCSGLVVYVYGQLGISLPHYTGSLWQVGSPVSRDQLQPGDLVFFSGLGHMGIYIGGGQMVHAPHTGDVVKISDISSGYYAASYVGARRV
jgi:cell wall-associated NlpC family hydrolase